MDEDYAVQILSDFADYLDQQIVRPAVAAISAATEKINPHRRKQNAEYWGEYLRESAVLIIVFIPIDLLIPRMVHPERPFPYWWAWFLGTLVISLALMWLGIVVGRGE